jgi:pimeloyl-ACP methyl ester carboxylesterase
VGAGRLIPSFAGASPITPIALRYAHEAHAGQRRGADGAAFILHPVEVASLLFDARAPDHLIAAGAPHRSGFPILKNPANVHHAVPLTFEEFHYAFTNTMGEEEARSAFERHAVPGLGRVLFQGAFANFNPRTPLQVDFKKSDRAPLLLIAGGSDHTVPAVVDKSMADDYAKSSAVTEYQEFPGRSHFTIGEHDWEEVADYALDWAVAHAAAPAAA